MTSSEEKTLAERIKREAREIGFDLAGVTAAGAATTHARYTDWLARGHHGGMSYLARPDAVARRADVRELLPSARSVVVVAMNYYSPLPHAARTRGRGVGVVARYAWGDDYHEVIAEKLERLAAFIEAESGRTVPRLYIAAGISGAIQHRAGMSESSKIIAINTDPNAPIFSIAHYKIVGDVAKVIPMLIRALREKAK